MIPRIITTQKLYGTMMLPFWINGLIFDFEKNDTWKVHTGLLIHDYVKEKAE
ncbi:MAG: hypothetical protein HRU40_14645 [Saprospiraceae bacterium]|nr:hypothetical protein [Saprospiraceae bacterium]